ncbi:ribonuclease activity regulator RraA [Spirochaetia bacterium]|nr:ribonuclease activity regulator RraA [Spirochaetia bacterium]
MRFDCKEDIIQMTPKWKGDRFDNGRPRVPDSLLKRIAANTITEIWKPLYIRGYKYQFERALRRTNPDREVMCGRAVTAAFIPTRPDLHKYLLEYGHTEEGRKGNFNQWAIEGLVRDDVLIYDMKDKVYEGCPLGGNLTNVIASKTGQGAITWGGMRDLEQVVEIKTAQFYYRDTDPTPFMDTMLIGINVPVKIGAAVCLPGDIVLGTMSGVLFIPPHLAEIAAVDAEKAHIRDIWGFIRVKEGKFTAAQVDSAWEIGMWEDFSDWFKKAKDAEPYQHLNFDLEMEDCRNGVVRKGMAQINEDEEDPDPNKATRW